MTRPQPVAIAVHDGRDLGYAAIPQAIIERLRTTLVAGPLTRALSSAVLVASELNLAQLRAGEPVWEPDKRELSERLMLSEHPARDAIAALQRAGMIDVQHGRWQGATKLPNRIALVSTDAAFCAVTRTAIAAITAQCRLANRGRAHALAVYLTLVWAANQQRTAHPDEPRRKATISYPAIAELSGVSEPQVRRVVKDLIACSVLEDATAKTAGPQGAKTWRLVEPDRQPQPTGLARTESEGVISGAPRPDLTSSTARSGARHGPLSDAPPPDLRSATARSEEPNGPVPGAPTRAREAHHDQQAPGNIPHAGDGSQAGGEGEAWLDETGREKEIAAVIEAMVAMLARRAGGNAQRARRRAQDPAWRQAGAELLDDGFSVAELTELMAIAENDLALGHRIVSLPAFNEYLDALQARRSAHQHPASGPGEGMPDVLVELVARTLRQAPPRAGRQEHLDCARRIDRCLADRHAEFLGALAWKDLGQREPRTLRHAVGDAWRAHHERRQAA